MEIIQNIRSNLASTFSEMPRNRRIILAVASVLLIAVITSLIILLTRPNYVNLYRGLDITTAAQITENLDGLSIPYQYTDTGDILVPEQFINQAKLQLANLGVPEAKFDYSDLIKQNTMFLSEDEKSQQRLYALQNEISKVIETIPSVNQAFVNVSLPKTSEFVLQENRLPAKASVFLKTKPNTNLSQDSIQGIAMLVSNSVEGLEVDNVTVHGPTGQVLSRSDLENGQSVPNNNLELQKLTQANIEESLTDFLSQIYGYGNVSVMASVHLNFDLNNTQSKKYEAPIEGESGGIVRSSQENIESVENKGQAIGDPGVNENATEDDQVAVYQTVDDQNAASNYNKNERIFNYEINEIIQTVEKAKGQIEDLTVAVVLNQDQIPGGELTEEMKSQISNLITAATGLQTKSVEIYAQPFSNQIQDMFAQEDGAIPLWAWIAIVIIALIPILLLGIYVFLRRRKQEAEASQQLEETMDELPDRLEEEQLIDLEIKESGRKKSIEALIETNPEIVTQMLKSWIEEE